MPYSDNNHHKNLILKYYSLYPDYGYAKLARTIIEEENLELSVEGFRRAVALTLKNEIIQDDESTDLYTKNKWIQEILENYSDNEIQAIAKGSRISPCYAKIPDVHFDGEKVKFALSSDWHLGSIYTHEKHISLLYDEIKKEGCEFLTIGGDLVEGMSGRPGHVYELSSIGYDAQKKNAIRILKDSPVQTFLIDGNHDRWFIKNSGAYIVKDVVDYLNKDYPNKFVFLGHDEGDITLKGGKAVLKLWHGEDGNSYAYSYRLQKVVESLTGGTKPHIMSFAHTHKFTYIFDRHIHCVSNGSIQTQSKWMRGKRISAHTGFVICEATIAKKGISSLKVEWKPFYA
jgi:hypothetical protein